MKFFPFEFFRSRFRRKSLKKFGGVDEEPLHIFRSNGGRIDGVLFEFQGEIAESTSIENILEKYYLAVIRMGCYNFVELINSWSY